MCNDGIAPSVAASFGAPCAGLFRRELTRQERRWSLFPQVCGLIYVAQQHSSITNDLSLGNQRAQLSAATLQPHQHFIAKPYTDRMEFNLKPARKKKHGRGAHLAKILCELAHCPRVPGHCTRWECNQQITDAIQSLENERLALEISVDSRIEEAKRLVAEIEKECDMEAFGSEPLSSSHAAFRADVQAQSATVDSDCAECRQELGKSEMEVMSRRLAATQDWLAALREYRSRNDLEFLQDQAGQVPEYTEHPSLLIEPC
jgi:hypothetical protein